MLLRYNFSNTLLICKHIYKHEEASSDDSCENFVANNFYIIKQCTENNLLCE